MKLIVAVCLLVLAGCGSFVPVVRVDSVPKERLNEASRIKTYTLDSNFDPAMVAKYLGNITSYSCKSMLTDPPASKGDALIQLRLYALDKSADGIIDVTFDTRGTDTWGTNCWETVQASGMAVKLRRAADPNP